MEEKPYPRPPLTAAAMSATAATISSLEERCTSAALRRGGPARVKAAFLVLGRLAPPAAGADVLARSDGARAGSAADRRIAAGVQRVDRQGVLARVLPHLGLGPGPERIELEDAAVGGVDLRHLDAQPRDRLFAAQPGDPGGCAGQRARARRRLAGGAATRGTEAAPAVERPAASAPRRPSSR